jgi:hypothetical protein
MNLPGTMGPSSRLKARRMGHPDQKGWGHPPPGSERVGHEPCALSLMQGGSTQQLRVPGVSVEWSPNVTGLLVSFGRKGMPMRSRLRPVHSDSISTTPSTPVA